jgi:hypothetical protein
MKPASIFKLTLYENINGQIFWISFFVAAILLFMLALISDLALTHQARMLDAASYFSIDIISFLTASMLGSQLFFRDFSNRGLAEIAIPSGMSRSSLLLSRLCSHIFTMTCIVAILMMVRIFSLYITNSLQAQEFQSTLHMFGFVTLKMALACSVATFLGCHTRPAISLLGTLSLFAFGHFSSGISGVKALTEDAGSLISPTMAFLLQALRIWNPNFLILESMGGKWENPAFSEYLMRFGWGTSAVFFFVALAMISVRRKDIDAMRF